MIPQWLIHLKSPPKVLMIGNATHGLRGLTEQYHTSVWAVLLHQYTGVVTVDGFRLSVKPGCVTVYPPGSTITIQYEGESSHCYIHFVLQGGRGNEIPIAALLESGKNARRFQQLFHCAQQCFTAQPDRANAIVWDILWELVDATSALSGEVPDEAHPALRQALDIIDRRLGESFTIAEIAEETSLSHRQLSNLFHRAFETTIVGYVRHRRVERAYHLLTQTSLPIKSIASEVGLSDLQFFNKTMRRETGLSPRQIRQRAVSITAPE